MLRLACAMQFDKLIAKQGEAGELALFLEEVLDPESVWGVSSGIVSYGRCFFDENKVTADIARKFPDNGSLKEGFRIRVRGKTLLPGAIEAVPCYEMRYWYDGEPGSRNNRGFYASEAYGEKVLTYHRALVFLANTEVLKCPQHLRANYQSSQAQIWDSFTGSRTFSNDGDYFTEAISDFSDDHIRFWQSRLDCIGISPSYIEYEVAELLASLGMGTIARQGFKKIAKNYALKKGWKVTIEAGEEILDNIFKLQKDEFLKYVDNIVTLSSNRKGAWGEIASDVFLQEKGYIALHSRKTAITQGWGESGIDAVFEKNGVYYIVEAKYKGQATLKTLADGTKQMSDPWIRGNRRLVDAVGEVNAQEIIDNGYKRLLAEIAPDGSVIYKELDASAKLIGTFTP